MLITWIIEKSWLGLGLYIAAGRDAENAAVEHDTSIKLYFTNIFGQSRLSEVFFEMYVIICLCK